MDKPKKVKRVPGAVASCGDCTLCCKVLGIRREGDMPVLSDKTEDGHKPIGEWCKHCSQEHGCTIYEERPDPCIEFECWWLQSQRTDHPMEEAMRPDKVRAVIVSNTETEVVTVNVPHENRGNWRKGRLLKFLTALDRVGMIVFVSCGDRRVAVSLAAARLVQQGVKVE